MISVDKSAIHVLHSAISQLPKLLQSDDWRSYFIDAEEPVVQRLWHATGIPDWRICLHRILPSDKAFLHPHRHPSCVLVCSGAYEMGVGIGHPDGPPPPIFGPITISAGNCYAMTSEQDWHYIRTIEETFSIMVTGRPYRVGRQLSRPQPRELLAAESSAIFEFFTPAVIDNALARVSPLLSETVVGLGEN